MYDLIRHFALFSHDYEFQIEVTAASYCISASLKYRTPMILSFFIIASCIWFKTIMIDDGNVLIDQISAKIISYLY